MRGLQELNYMNAREAAKFLKRRYEKLRRRAIDRQDWARATRYDREVADLGRFINRQIIVFPSRRNREAGCYTPSVGRDFKKGGAI